MRVLVTGAAGFIGSHLCDRLLDDGHQVSGLDSFSDNYSRTLKERNLASARRRSGFSFFELDLVEDDLRGALEGVDVVFHVAGRSGLRPSRRNPLDHYLRDNVVATERLLTALSGRDLRRFVYAGSWAVYGEAMALPTKESSLPRPLSWDGLTKLAGEDVVHLHGKNFGVPVVSLRYFTVYGPRQRPDMAVARFFAALDRGDEVDIYGDGEQTRDFTFVSDVVEATVRAATEDVTGMTINVGGGSRTTMSEVTRMLGEITGARVLIKRLPATMGEQRHSSASINVARRHLGWEPRVGLREGLRRQWAWLQENRVAKFNDVVATAAV